MHWIRLQVLSFTSGMSGMSGMSGVIIPGGGIGSSNPMPSFPMDLGLVGGGIGNHHRGKCIGLC